MLLTLLELHARDGGHLRLARLAGEEHEDGWLFVGSSLGPVTQVQRLTRDQAVELIDVLEEWLFDTSEQGRRRPLNTATVQT